VLSKNLAVKRVGISYHLSIQYQSGNPNRAAQIANAIAGAYITEQLEGRYLKTINKEANWSRKYGANHLAVVNLREQIRDIWGSILEELKRLRGSYLSNYEIAQAGRSGA
jgi:succinoglycan biosynthesis transport protein ExoP